MSGELSRIRVHAMRFIYLLTGIFVGIFETLAAQNRSTIDVEDFAGDES